MTFTNTYKAQIVGLTTNTKIYDSPQGSREVAFKYAHIVYKDENDTKTTGLKCGSYLYRNISPIVSDKQCYVTLFTYKDADKWKTELIDYKKIDK